MGYPFPIGSGLDHAVDIENLVAVLIHVLENDATALQATFHEQDVQCAAHGGHLDFHLVIVRQDNLHVTIDQDAAWAAHHDLATQQFGHQFLGVVMITGNIVDNVAPDAFNRLPALLLKPLELNVFLDLQLGAAQRLAVLVHFQDLGPVVGIFDQQYAVLDSCCRLARVDGSILIQDELGICRDAVSAWYLPRCCIRWELLSRAACTLRRSSGP